MSHRPGPPEGTLPPGGTKLMGDSWPYEFERRMQAFSEPFTGAGIPVSVKVRAVSGCFHREDSPHAYRPIDLALRDSRLERERDTIRWHEHESGPELLVWIPFVTAGVAFSAAAINLVVSILKARSDGIKAGDRPREPVVTLVRPNIWSRSSVVIRMLWVSPVVLAAVGTAACGQIAGGSPEEVAASVVQNVKFSRRAVDRAKAYGDEILEPLRKESKDFTALDGPAPLRVLEILSSNTSSKSEELLEELAHRKAMMARLIGVAGLARRGKLRWDPDAEEFLIRVAAGRLTDQEQTDAWVGEGNLRGLSSNTIRMYQQLAVVTLGAMVSENAVPSLAAMLEDEQQEPTHGTVCEALGKIGGQGSLAALRDALGRPDFQATVKPLGDWLL